MYKSMRINKSSLYALMGMVGLLAGACKQSAKEQTLFGKVDSTQSGIGFINRIEDTDKLNILDYLYFYNGGGVSAGDINNDGLTDLFFVSNQGKNKLYLNKGAFKFEDISAKAGVEGFSDWQTGVTMADVNGDGLLDIYVCAVGNYKGLEGSNELYINNGDLTFTEKAAEYGLDFTGFSTQAAFFDYDKDGDLDMYLLNHAVHTSRSYDRVLARNLRNNEAGDYLYRNDGKKFTDVSEQSGIYGAAMGYGLGIAVGDMDNDGWDDIYVSNDFHEDDYYYRNNGNGTFTESLKKAFRHISRYSMGNDLADINNDGFLDLITLDMYPEDEKVEKSSMGEDPFDTYLVKLDFGFFNQYSRNTLQINLSGQKFSDVGAMAGVAATDWSWAPLLADYDNDGIKDLFITNGIVHRPNDLDYIKYISADSIREKLHSARVVDQKVLGNMPDGKVHNYLYRGTERLRYEDKSIAWGFEEPTCSNGAAYVDLDNDGDLDLITNNINSLAGIYQNFADTLIKNHFLRIKLEGNKPNTFGIGAKITVKAGNQRMYQQQMPTRGFLSSVDPTLNFGVGKSAYVDTLLVTWPDGKKQVRTHVAANATLTLRQAEATASDEKEDAKPTRALFEEVTTALPLDYRHQENRYYDFYRESLIPFQVSTEGPKLAVGDVNGDGLEDFYVGGAKWQAGKLFLQKENGQFMLSNVPVIRLDSACEDVDAAFFDADNDQDLDLYVVSGGNEYYDKMTEQFDRLYLNDGKGNFSRSDGLPPMFDNKSCVKPCDFDKDGDIDLFVGGRVVAYQYGILPNSYLLVNEGKGPNGQPRYTDQTQQLAPALRKAGLVTAAEWADIDKDGDMDLTVVGDWMPIRTYENRQGKLVEITSATGLNTSNGLWQSLQAADVDDDGDVDFLVGNLGTNTKFRKKEDSQLRMYVKDMDGNSTLEHVLSYSVGNRWYPVASKDELGKQLPLINKKFTTYHDFAGKTVDEIFTKEQLKDAKVLEVNHFESVYLENMGNKQFRMHILPKEAQVSKIFAFHVADVDQDGHLDVLLGGNLYGVSTYQGRYDASYGLLLKGNGKGEFAAVLPTHSGLLLEGQIRDITSLKTPKGDLWLVARNGEPLQIFRKTNVSKPVVVTVTK